MKHVDSYQAKTHLPRPLDSVEQGETFVITRNGRTAARLVPVTFVISDPADAVKALKEFGDRHRGRLRGLPIRHLIDDGRRS
jgi:antitoxin (DNA-binding transcriptional repressor) of toxin-antitoxin stability system